MIVGLGKHIYVIFCVVLCVFLEATSIDNSSRYIEVAIHLKDSTAFGLYVVLLSMFLTCPLYIDQSYITSAE